MTRHEIRRLLELTRRWGVSTWSAPHESCARQLRGALADLVEPEVLNDELARLEAAEEADATPPRSGR